MSNFLCTASLPSHDHSCFCALRIPGLHDVKYVSTNSLGQIFWKGEYICQVEGVFDDSYWDCIQDLGLHCLHLESLGVPVNNRTAGTHAAWFSGMQSHNRYQALLSRCPDIYVGSNRMLMCFARAISEFDGRVWHYALWNVSTWSQRNRKSLLAERGYFDGTLASSSLADVLSALNHFRVPTDLLDRMSGVIRARRKI